MKLLLDQYLTDSKDISRAMLARLRCRETDAGMHAQSILWGSQQASRENFAVRCREPQTSQYCMSLHGWLSRALSTKYKYLTQVS